jgi:hypothetical protein
MRISPFDLEQLYSVTQLCISNMNYRLWIQENNNHFTCIYLPFCYRYLGVIFRADVSCDKPIRSEVMMICFFLHFYLCDIFSRLHFCAGRPCIGNSTKSSLAVPATLFSEPC